MTKLVSTAAIAVAALAIAAAFAPDRRPPIAAPAIDDPLREALSGIDFVGKRGLFDRLLGTQAAADLIAIARDPGDEIDPGLRIRAYDALSLYPEDTIGALLDAVNEHTSALVQSGVEIIYAKSAMRSLAIIAGQASATDRALSLGQLSNALEHPVLDVRAAAARSLGKSGLVGATAILNQRLTVETSELVRTAIVRAIISLGGS